MKNILSKFKIVKLIHIYLVNILNFFFIPIKGFISIFKNFYLIRLFTFYMLDSDKLILQIINDTKFIVSTNDKVNSKKIYVGKYFPQMVEFDKAMEILKKNEKDIESLIDVGAHYGNISIPAIKKYKFNKVYAIEPILENYEILNYNILLNKLNENIKTFNYFVSNEEGELSIDIFSNNTAAATSTTKMSNENIKEYTKFNNLKSSGKTFVQQKTMNSIFKSEDMDKILIWIYAQGSEYKILRGSSKLLESRPPLVLAFNPVLLQKNDDDYLLKFIKFFKEYKYDTFYNLSNFVSVKEDINLDQFEMLDKKLKKSINTNFLLLI